MAHRQARTSGADNALSVLVHRCRSRCRNRKRGLVPRWQMIRRYTEEGGNVLEMFMGSGTTLFECETLGRNYIGFDINDEIINFVESKMDLASAKKRN